MNKKVLCVGELLIDFICTDINVDLIRGEHFVKKAGGAPANVAVALARLGTSAAFAGKVGRDAFGDFLEQTLLDKGVDTVMLKKDPDRSTTLAFVSLDHRGERDFMFNRGADAHHEPADIDQARLGDYAIRHFGSATALLGGVSRQTYRDLLSQAKAEDVFVSFDPNHRVDLWKGRAGDFIQEVLPLLSGVDFLKVSEEELQLLCGTADLEKGVRFLHDQGAAIIAVTRGGEGTWISNGTRGAQVGSIRIRAVDSTGAGDAFVGAFLSKVAQLEDPAVLLEDFELLEQITGFANRVGAMVCTRTGAIDAIPSLAEVLATYGSKGPFPS